MTHEPGVKISFLKQEWLLGGITASCCSLGPSTGFAHAGGSALASLGIADHSVCVFLQISAPPHRLPRFHGCVTNGMEERTMLGWGKLFALGIILHF